MVRGCGGGLPSDIRGFSYRLHELEGCVLMKGKKKRKKKFLVAHSELLEGYVLCTMQY